MNNCTICAKHKNFQDFVIYENHDLVVSHLTPMVEQPHVYLGYCFIEPKTHLTQIWQLSDEQMQNIGLWVKRLSLAHKELLQAEKTYFLKFADITPHLHVHVFPRHPQTPASIIGDAVRSWNDGPKGDRQEIIKLCRSIRNYFA